MGDLQHVRPVRRHRVLAAAAGLGADRLVGEPSALHPVAGFGALMGAVERRVYADRRRAGVAYTAVGVGVAATSGAVLEAVAGAVGVVTATWSAAAARMLHDSADAVAAALAAGDLDGARALLPTLVGRDPTDLDETAISRAVVESVAENTVDAIVAPAFWAASAGAAGVLAHRAVNTMDAMVGHRSVRYLRFGWASARLDDVAAWVPARLTAAAVVVVRPRRAAAVWRAVRVQAPRHPSPNAGVAEAAFAAALGVTVGGRNRYGPDVEERSALGAGPPPEPADIGRAVALSRDVTSAVAGVLVAGSVVAARRRRGRASSWSSGR